MSNSITESIDINSTDLFYENSRGFSADDQLWSECGRPGASRCRRDEDHRPRQERIRLDYDSEA
jgi:hypothetical protein